MPANGKGPTMDRADRVHDDKDTQGSPPNSDRIGYSKAIHFDV